MQCGQHEICFFYHCLKFQLLAKVGDNSALFFSLNTNLLEKLSQYVKAETQWDSEMHMDAEKNI